MIHSMTGFGKATVQYASKKITIELRSLNGRYAEINLKIPPAYKEKEILLRKHMATALERGKIECTLTLDYETEAEPNLINSGLVKAYYKQLSSIANELNITENDFIPAILKIPQVMLGEKEEVAEEEWLAITSAMDRAIEELVAFRTKEGANLQIDIKNRVELITENLAAVEKLLPIRQERVKQNLRQSIQQLKLSEDIDENRFEEELIYYLEKQDITEETVRLNSHLQGFAQLLDAPGISKGKKLNFFSQEMGREINTIGSKANDADIQKKVVNMKDDLEKIKEQLLNIL